LNDEQPAAIKIDYTVSPTRANLVALALTPLVVAVFFVPYVVLWPSASLQAALDDLLSPFLLILAFSVVAHELLHGVGAVLVGGVPWREIAFGIKGLMVYAHCKTPMAASAYRVTLALPGVLLGFVPGALGLVWGNAWLIVYGVLMSIAALGDAIVVWLIRSVPNDACVQDHPSAPGCQVLLEPHKEREANG
jgi:hypothetical protein